MERGEDAPQSPVAAATGRQDGKRSPEADSKPTSQTTAVTTEENLSALSNLRVAGENDGAGTAQTQSHARPALTRPSPGADASSSRNKVRRISSYANPTTPQDTEDLDRVSKSSLSFILDNQASTARNDDFAASGKRAAALLTRSRSTGDLVGEATSTAAAGFGDIEMVETSSVSFTSGGSSRSSSKQGDGKRRARRPPSRICKHEGCEQYVVDQGLCVRHGGGKRCLTEGCTSRAKHQGRCWRHGGSTQCKVASCMNRAKSRGFCWSHGGGTKCKFETCEKIAISNGLCWAHGGGKRCAVKGCMRQAYERTANLCNNHYQERQQGAAAGTGEGDSDSTAASNWQADDEEKPSVPPSNQ